LTVIIGNYCIVKRDIPFQHYIIYMYIGKIKIKCHLCRYDECEL